MGKGNWKNLGLCNRLALRRRHGWWTGRLSLGHAHLQQLVGADLLKLYFPAFVAPATALPGTSSLPTSVTRDGLLCTALPT